ncbi:MAG TPA: hypothetical protein EYG04_05715 [Candidatus Poseidoniales archaeon]|nr:hypothetical protein [Candidatus Poseidoniales archaeon]
MEARTRITCLILCSLLLSSFAPIVKAEESSFLIEAYWVGEDGVSSAHIWKISTESEPASLNDLTFHILHEDVFGLVIYENTTNLSSLNGSSSTGEWVAFFPSPSTLGFADQILLEVLDGSTVLASRGISVSQWNEPLEDHEITISTEWEIDQNYEDENGTQMYTLFFDGQGWQQRVGTTLVANELGTGTLFVYENSVDDSMTLDLTLTSIWRNETSESGVLDAQEFEARGMGNLLFSDFSSGSNTSISANVTSAIFNRSYEDGSHSERIFLNAYGGLTIAEEGDGDNGTWIDGVLNQFVLDNTDVDGIRTHSYLHFDADAQMEIIDGDDRLDIDLNRLVQTEEWQDGIRIDQYSLIHGDGTFGAADEEDNGTANINGTIIEIKQESIDGLTTADRLHVDGTIEGDASGEFGMLRYISETGQWNNYNGTEFDINVIHQQFWLNLTSVGGWSNGGQGAGSQHNETWSYDTPQIDWENKTIFRRWDSSGILENSDGEEYPNGSPIQNQPEAPEAEEGLGEANISRESGLVPVPLMPGDEVILDSNVELVMHVSATELGALVKDGHSLAVTQWTGVYVAADNGTASGSVINNGVLNGLIAEVVRIVETENTQGEPLWFNESQTIERVLSPSIVSSSENLPPSIISSGITEGLVVNELGSSAHLFVQIEDVDWNTISVSVDLSEFDLGVIELNDKGLDGDEGINDDTWTAEFKYAGILHGDFFANISVVDYWGATAEGVLNLTIFNQAPRLTDFEFTPSQVIRGDSIIVNAEVYDGNGVSEVALDFRLDGGLLVPLEYNSVISLWSAMIEIPDTLNPGDYAIKVMMVDSDGAIITVTDKQLSAIHGVNTDGDEIPLLTILNDGPVIDVVSIDANPILRPTESTGTQIITAYVTDVDGLHSVLIELSDLSPPGQQGHWQSMRDDGQGDDAQANDGIWTYTLETRTGMPLGTFAVTVKAIDIFGAWNSDDSLGVVVAIDDGGDDGPPSPNSLFDNSAVIFGMIGVLALIAIGVVILIIRGDGEEDGGMDWGSPQ